MPDYTRLKPALNTTGLQQKDNALWQVISQLLIMLQQTQNQLDSLTGGGSGGGGGGGGVTGATYLTKANETGALPNSAQLLAGAGVEFNDLPGKRIITVAIPIGLDAGGEGADGDVGPPGTQGKDGTSGPQGSNAVSFMYGYDGEDGIDGDPGIPGPIGFTGPQGIQGQPGQFGIDGNDGEPGVDGFPGPSGPSGPIGPTGSAGIPGPPGFDGIDGIDAFEQFLGNVLQSSVFPVSLAQISISTADYRGIGTTAIAAIPAPGAGKVNIPIAYGYTASLGVAFTGITIVLQFNNGVTFVNIDAGIAGPTTANNTFIKFKSLAGTFTNNVAGTTAQVENFPIVLASGSSPGATGTVVTPSGFIFFILYITVST